jgi:YbbR domain-containing protein
MIRPFRQFHLKLLALLAAVTLWFVVITVENTVYKFPEKVELKTLNLSKNVSLESALPAVDVYLRVDKEDMKKITKNELDIYLDLTDFEAGERTVPVVALSKSPLAQVLKTEPSEVKIKISPVIEKEVQVKISVEGSPRDGYKVEKTEILSKEVTVLGAQSVIEMLDYIEGKIILDGTQTENLKQTVQLSVPGSSRISPQLLTFNPAETVVEVTIVSELEEKELTVKPRFFSENDRAAYESKIEMTPLTVKVSAGKEILEKLDFLETNPLEMTALIRNGSIETGLSLPEGVSLVNPSQKITVKFTGSSLGDGPTI